MDPLALLCEKLQAQHPQLQRIAVSSIFERFRSSISLLETASGTEALTRCISSPSSSVIDQSVREICTLAKTGAIPPSKAIHYLQTSLDSVATPAMAQLVVNGIGFVCRASISDPSVTFTINPLLKALQTRKDAHMEVLQQVRLMLLQHGKTSSPQERRTMEFIRQIVAPVYFDPINVDFAQKLHSTLCILAMNHPDIGFRLMNLLLHYVQFRNVGSSQDLDFVSNALEELLNVLEVISDTPRKLAETKDCVKATLRVMVKLCRITIEQQLSAVCILTLIKRASTIALEVLASHEIDVYVFAFAHILAVTEVEMEQLLIVSLALSWINHEDNDENGVYRSRVLCMLYWIFPLLHILSFPSGPLRDAAVKMLYKVEGVLSSTFNPKLITGSLSVEAEIGVDFQLLCELWTENQVTTWLTPASESEKNPTVAWLMDVRSSLTVESGFPLRLAMLVTVLLFHPNGRIASASSRVLSTIGRLQPIWGMSLLPVLLFALKFWLEKDSKDRRDVTIALLHSLPDICSHPTTLPLSTHLLQSMMDNKLKIIASTVIRLLYKMWEASDRTFPQIQKYLQPSSFTEAPLEAELVLSKAIALRDICKHDSDRGIDLVFSVQTCIESSSHMVKALGLQALAFLCDDEAIDFYTAWKVVSKFFEDPQEHPALAESWSILLKHGAVEAAAYPNEAHTLLNILRNFAFSNGCSEGKWSTVRSAALQSMAAYEVELLKEKVEFDRVHMEALISEKNLTAKRSGEALLVKFLEYEHSTRQRSIATAPAPSTRFGKLLEGIPRTFLGGKNEASVVIESAGATLLMWRPPVVEPPAPSSKRAAQKALKNESDAFHNFFKDAVKHMSIGSDPISMTIALQSWTWFLSNWASSEIRMRGETKTSLEHLMKICMNTIDHDIPRVAENATLALASLTKSSPQAGLEISASVTKYLQSRLQIHGNAYADGSTAMALGRAASTLHTTDWALKSKTVQLLVECACSSRNGITVAAAAIGLAHISQSLLLSSRVHDSDRELNLLSTILSTLLGLLRQVCPLSASTVDTLAGSEFLHPRLFTPEDAQRRAFDSEVEAFWAAAGLVSAVGSSVIALERAGEKQLVKEFTQAIVGWLPESLAGGGADVLSLTAGASLALSTCFKASYRLELLDDTTVRSALRRFRLLLGHTFKLEHPTSAHAFRAGCIGAGDFVAGILQTGAYPLDVNDVKELLKLLEQGYNAPQTAQGALFGLANALGSGAGIVSDQRTKVTTTGYGQVGESKVVLGPLMFSSANEELLRSMVQTIVGISHSNQDIRVRSYARWSLGFMHTTWLQVQHKDETAGSTLSENWAYRPVILSGLSDHSTLRFLCEWLASIGIVEASVPCGSVISVLQCLQRAPRLPGLDWGGLVRRLMRHSNWFCESNQSWNHTEIRKSCASFCLQHAESVPPLASVLDELFERSRFGALESPLQNELLEHLSDLQKGFSLLRMEALLQDLEGLLGTLPKHRQQDFRVHCWRGLKGLVAKPGKLQTPVERFLRTLASSLDVDENRDGEEWKTAVDCMRGARQEWILETFQVEQTTMVRYAVARSRMVIEGVLPVSALQPLRSWLLNRETTVKWEVLVEVAYSLKNAEVEEKLRWLMDALDVACASDDPATTAIEFLALVSSLWGPCSYLHLIGSSSLVLEHLPRSLSTLVLVDKKWMRSASEIVGKVFALARRLSSISSPLYGLLQRTVASMSQHLRSDLLVSV